MLSRVEPILKFLCLGLAALLCVQLVNLLRGDESAVELRVPEVKVETPKVESKPSTIPGNPMPAGMPQGMKLPPGMAMPPGMKMPPGAMPGRPPGPGRGGPPLEPEFQARVDTIIKSQIFGAIPKPPPMALQGIAGDSVMLRAPNGRTGLIGVGEELGGVKLLKIGTNRILIEHEGKEKELTLFSGYGSESLLNQAKETRK